MHPFRRISKNPRSNIIRIGNREIITQGLNSGFWTDLYHRSMTLSWPVFFASAALVFIDGRNVRIDVRWGAVDPERIRSYAAELIALAPEVIVATGSAIVGSLLLRRTAPASWYTEAPTCL
jgi:hypothetical protein